MVHIEYWLPNDNVVIWIGHKDTIGTSNPSENALILMGGDVLLFNTTHKISLNDENIRKDLLALSHQEFETKYKVEIDSGLWVHLKEKVERSFYPPFKNKERFSEYSMMISKYLAKIDSSLDEARKEQFHKNMIRESFRKLKKTNKNELDLIISIIK